MTTSRRRLLARSLLLPAGAVLNQAVAQTTPAAVASAPPPAVLRPGQVDPATRRRVPSIAPGEPGATTVAAPSVINNIAGRSKTRLDGKWRVVADPFDTIRKKPRDRRNVWQDKIETPESVIIEYEWETTPEFTVPNDWNTHVETMHLYDGTAYFRRRFDAQPKEGMRQFLYFEAINYRSTVWLNGQNLGGHEGGFTPFSFDVTGKLVAGNNLLVVRADSRHDDETLPAADFDWHNYGGITRSVWMVETPTTFVRHWFLRLKDSNMLADVQLDGPAAANASVTIEIAQAGIKLSGATDSKGMASMQIPTPTGLKLWSPAEPTMYEVTVTAGGDVQKDKMGFRTITTRGRELLLNGKPLFLRGISMHEEPISKKGGRHVSERQGRELLKTAKDMGCNFVRLAHYPHGEHMLRSADEMGLLVWAEIPVYWEDVTYTSAKTLSLAKNMMSEMILRDSNRASVIMWSVANETPEMATRLKFLEALIAHVRQIDSSRLITAALNKNADIGGARPGETKFIVNDPLGASLDVIAANQYEAWYSALKPGQLNTVSFSCPYDKPFMISEFGADALLGHRTDKSERWSEDFQAYLFDETLKMIDRIPGLVGLTPWLLKDFRSPRRWHGRFQQNWNRKGMISEDGKRKLAFEVLRKYYSTKP
jgi:beta-glucuronidase